MKIPGTLTHLLASTSVLFLALLASCSPAPPPSSASPPPMPSPDQAPLTGVWEFVAAKYGDRPDFAPADTNVAKVKFITPGRFLWVEYHRASGRIRSAAGGRCTLEGTRYSETIDYIGPGMEDFMGLTLRFTEEIRGDQLHHRGALPDGTRIEEIWKRPTAARGP